MTDPTIPQPVLFPDRGSKPVVATFDREQASSDGGAVLLKTAARVYDLVKRFARWLVDTRGGTRGVSRAANRPRAGLAKVQTVLQAGLDLRDRCHAGIVNAHGLASGRGRLEAQLARLVDAPPRFDDARRFAAHLATGVPGGVPIPGRPVGRRHQLARRTGHPTRRRHPQGLRVFVYRVAERKPSLGL